MTLANFWQWLIHLDLTPFVWIVGLAFGGTLVLAAFGLLMGTIIGAVDSFKQKRHWRKQGWTT